MRRASHPHRRGSARARLLRSVALTQSTLSDAADVTMYETLVRNYDTISIEQPTIGDVLTRLHATEAKKAERREGQMAAARQRKADAAAAASESAAMNIDAVEEAGAAAVVPANGEAVETVSNKRPAADDAIDPPASKRARVDEAPLATDSSAPATPAPAPATNGKTANGAASWHAPQRLLSARPLIQARGHTSFLTFATLAPHSTRPPAASEPAAAASAAPLGRSLSKDEMDDLCAGAMETTQSTL